MRNRNIEKGIFAIVFFAFLLGMGILSAKETFLEIKARYANSKQFESVIDEVEYLVSETDTQVSEHVAYRYDWIEAYGTINRMLGKKEINGFDYALDKSGAYEPINFWSEAKDIDLRVFAQRILMLKNDVESYGGNFTFMMFPHKMNDSWNEKYEGIPYNDFNSQADTFLAWLEFYGVDYIDFRETLKDTGMSFEEMFYKTDHHWNGEASFIAFQELTEYMNGTYAAGFDPEGYYTNRDNYSFEWVPSTFLGAAGRDVGLSYTDDQLEDFLLVKPKFKTNYEWTNNTEGSVRSELLLSEKVAYERPYKSDAYRFYLDGIHERDTITNLDNEDGPTLCFVRDSYASPIIVDVAPYFSKIDCAWGKYASDRYVKHDIVANKPDYVWVGYFPENLIEEFFKFYSDDVEKYKIDYAISQGYMQEGE